VVLQDSTGSFELNYINVITKGRTMTRFNRKGGFHISKWTGTDDSAEWFLHVDNPGAYKVTINYAANKGSEGIPFEINIASSVFNSNVIYTGEWFDFHKFSIGYIAQLNPGDYTLAMRPKESGENYLMWLKSITLNPVEIVKKEGWGVN